MKWRHLLLFISLSFSLEAQPVLLRDAMPERGNRFHYAVVDGEIDPGPAGENVHWDFSDCSSYGLYELLFLDPEETPLGDSIFEADLVIQESQSFRIDYYQLDNATFSLVGSTSPASLGLETRYSDPWIALQFPFTYKSRFIDQFFASTTMSADEDERFRVISGQSEVVADGWGTLEIQGKQIPNILRIASDIYRVDSIFSDDGSMDIRHLQYLQYDFWNVVNGLLAAQWKRTEGFTIKINPDRQADTSSIGPSYRFVYENSASTPFSINRSNKELIANPNPFEGVVHLHFFLEEPEQLLLQVIDTEGPIVKQEWLPAHRGWNKHDIEVEGSPGIYRILMEGPKTIMSAVLLKSQ